MFKRKILIVDDEEDILDLIETVLIKEGFKNIYKINNGKEALEKFDEISPDLMILDIMLGDMDGYGVCRDIRSKSKIPILFLSAKAEEIDKVIGFSLGGDDYITKPFSPIELAYRVKANLRRMDYMDEVMEEELEFGSFKMNLSKFSLTKDGENIDLKPKEYKILEYLAKAPNYIKTKEQIYNNVWGEEYIDLNDTIDNSIMVHIRRLRKKIEDDPSNPKYIKTVRGLGYKLEVKD